MLALIGDIHLNKLTHRIPNFNSYVIKTLHSTIKDALDYGASAIAMVGDVFDSPYPSQQSQVEFLDAVTDYDVPVYIICGNHDYADATIDSLGTTRFTRKLRSNIIVIDKPKIIKIDGIAYHFMPHPYVEPMSKKADFAVGHFAVNGARGDNGFRVKTKNQPKGNWLLGDFHEGQSGNVKGCIYEYIGSMTQLSWEEKPNKSYMCIEDGVKIRRKIDLSYKLIKKTISSDEELNEIEFKKNHFYYLRTKGRYLLPKGWMLDHPSVVRQAAIGRKQDKRAEVLVSGANSDIVNEVKPTQYLEPFLLSKKYPREVVASCLKLAESMWNTKIRTHV